MKGVDMDIGVLEEQFHGSTLAKLIKHHMKSQSEEEIVNAVRGTYSNFSEEQMPIIDEFTQDYLEKWFDESIYTRDLGELFSNTLSDIQLWVVESNLQISNERAFDIFNILVMKMTHFAHSRPKIRKMIGIKKGLFS